MPSASITAWAGVSVTRADPAGHVYVADQQDYSSLPAYRSAEDAGVTAECAKLERVLPAGAQHGGPDQARRRW